MKFLANLCFVCGFLSIAASISIWYLATKDVDISPVDLPDNRYGLKEQGQRFAIFVGLWAPTFFILSERLEKLSAN